MCWVSAQRYPSCRNTVRLKLELRNPNTVQCWLLFKSKCHNFFSSLLTRESGVVMPSQDMGNLVVCISWVGGSCIFHSLWKWLATASTKRSAVLAGDNWSSTELCRCSGPFFNCPGNRLDCEISGQESSSVLLNHHNILTFLILADVSEEKGRWQNFLS